MATKKTNKFRKPDGTRSALEAEDEEPYGYYHLPKSKTMPKRKIDEYQHPAAQYNAFFKERETKQRLKEEWNKKMQNTKKNDTNKTETRRKNNNRG